MTTHEERQQLREWANEAAVMWGTPMQKTILALLSEVERGLPSREALAEALFAASFEWLPELDHAAEGFPWAEVGDKLREEWLAYADRTLSALPLPGASGEASQSDRWIDHDGEQMLARDAYVRVRSGWEGPLTDAVPNTGQRPNVRWPQLSYDYDPSCDVVAFRGVTAPQPDASGEGRGLNGETVSELLHTIGCIHDELADLGARCRDHLVRRKPAPSSNGEEDTHS